MTENSKKIFITTKTSEIFIIRRGRRKLIHVFCPDCKREVEMLLLDEAVSFSAQNTRELIRRIDAGEIHALETGSGHLLVCQNSLENFRQK
jgi:hypothetical protein